jgi:hypothetical protein
LLDFRIRTIPENESNADDDLFWAVMGGSPGNFGILTHVIVRPLHDENYPDSRMMKSYCIYSKEKHEACLQLLAEMASDVEFPRNFDCCVTVMTDAANSFLTKKGKHHSRFLRTFG